MTSSIHDDVTSIEWRHDYVITAGYLLKSPGVILNGILPSGHIFVAYMVPVRFSLRVVVWLLEKHGFDAGEKREESWGRTLWRRGRSYPGSLAFRACETPRRQSRLLPGLQFPRLVQAPGTHFYSWAEWDATLGEQWWGLGPMRNPSELGIDFLA